VQASAVAITVDVVATSGVLSVRCLHFFCFCSALSSVSRGVLRCLQMFLPPYRQLICRHRYGQVPPDYSAVELAMPESSLDWSDVAGGLCMPAEFAHYFSQPLPPVPNNNLSPERCSSSLDVSAVMPLPSPSIRRGRRLCLLCHGQHSENEACACRRCGYRHLGDCVTVCSLCHRDHPASTPCRASGKVYLTAKRRASIVFSNDDDGIVDRCPFPKHDLGLMVVECPHCRARSWRHEKLNCCHGGDVVVEWDIDVPLELSAIILSSHVRQNIRSYNTVMAFASTGHDNKSLIGGTFVLSGRAYHRIGPLLPGKRSLIFV